MTAGRPAVPSTTALVDGTAVPSSRLVAVAGDWHGDTGWAVEVIAGLGNAGVTHLLHVGDFGVWPGADGARFVEAVDAAAAAAGVTVLVTPGNHEDWDLLDAWPLDDRGDGLGAVQWLRHRVAVAPRGHRWSMRSPSGVARSFVSLGGAPSIDFEYRTPGRSWWPGEMITAAHVAAVVAAGHAEVMIAHDAPGPPYAVDAVADILTGNPIGWSDRALAYAAEGRALITEAFEGVAPRVFFHGHYHAHGRREVGYEDGRSGLVVALDQQRTVRNVAVVDLDTLEVTTPWRP